MISVDERTTDRLWLHRGGLEGFSNVATPLPMPWPTDAVDDRGPVPTWTLVDVDGDRRLDLVSARPDPVLGAPEQAWWVYFGVADPDALLVDTLLEAPVAWSTPTPLDRIRDGGTVVRWRSLDFDGDGVLDLVVASEDMPRTWQLHRGRCRPADPYASRR